MTLNGDSLNNELKNVDVQEEPMPSTSRQSSQPLLFGSDNLNLLSTDRISLNSFNPTDSSAADVGSRMMLANKELKNVDAEHEPMPSPFVFGSDNLSLLSTDNFSLNSFNPTDLNSADDVRQGVKYMALTSQGKELQNLQLHRETPGPSRALRDAGDQEPRCSTQRHQSRTKLKVSMKERGDDESKGQTDNNQKRTGRPPKAGPSRSKKLKKETSVTHLYKGKLSNYVRFRKRSNQQSSGDSDLESCVYSSS